MTVPRSAPPSFAKPLYILSATFFFIFMGAGAQQAYLVPYLQKVAGWTRLQASLIVASVYFSMVLFRPANLYLFRSWSDRRFTMVGSLTYLWFTVSMFLTAYVKSYPLALASAWLWGAGAAMMWTGTAMQTLALADQAGGRHGTGMGILYSSTHAGWLAGAILLGKVYQASAGGREPLLYVVATGITLIGIALAFSLPDTPGTPREVPSFRNMLGIMLRRNEAIACVLQFMSALGYGLILGLFTSYVGEVHGREWMWISVALYPATRMIISAVSGRLTDRLGYAPVLAAGFAVGAVGLLLTVTWQSPYSAAVTAISLGLLGSTVPVVAGAMVGKSSELKQRPLAHAIVFSWRDLGVAVAAVGANLLGLKFQLDSVFTVFAGVFGLCALLSLGIGRIPKPNRS